MLPALQRDPGERRQVLAQQVAGVDEFERRGGVAAEVVLPARVALLHRGPRVAGGLPLARRPRERQERPHHAGEFVRRPGLGAEQVPAGVGGERDRHFRQPDAGGLVPVGVHRGDPDGEAAPDLRRLLRHDPLLGEPRPVVGAVGVVHPVGSGHAGDGGEPEVLRRHRGARLHAGVAARRRFRPAPAPLVHGEQQRPLAPAEVVRVRRLLPDGDLRREPPRPVLGAGVEIDPRVVGDYRVFRGVHRGVDQAGGAAPVLVGGVRVEDPGVEPLALAGEQSFGAAGFRVGLLDVGEREDVRRVELVEVGVGVAGGLGEAVVETAAPAAGHIGDHAVEDPAPALVAVEPVVEEGAEEPAALGDAEAEGAVEVVRADAERVGAVVAEAADQVADPRRAEPHQRRVLRPVHDFVDAVGLEAALDPDRAVVRDRGAVLDPPEAPPGPRDRFPLVLDPAADGEDIRFVVGVGDAVGPVVPVGEGVVRRLGPHREVGADEAGDRRAVRVRRDRREHPHPQRVVVGDIPLPAQPEQGEPPAQQEAVAEVRPGLRPEAALGHVEVGEEPLPPPVVHFEQQRSPPLRHDFRAEEVEVGGHLDLPVGVHRGEPEVRDDPVRRVLRVEGEVDDADDPLVGPGQPEAPPAQQVAPLGDLEPDDFGGRRRPEREQEGESRQPPPPGREAASVVPSRHGRKPPLGNVEPGRVEPAKVSAGRECQASVTPASGAVRAGRRPPPRRFER